MNFDDLLTLDSHEQGCEMQVINPNTGEKTDVYITLLGEDSKTYRKNYRKALLKVASEKDNDDYDSEEEDLELLVHATIGWRGLTENKKPVEFTKERAYKLYKNAPPIAQQAYLFIRDRKNFTKG